MSGQASSSVTWRELARVSSDCIGIQVGEVFVYVAESFADHVGAAPETIVGIPPDQFLRPVEGWLQDRSAAGSHEQQRPASERSVADAVHVARRDGFWTGRLRVQRATGTAGIPPTTNSTFEVTIAATSSGALVWKSVDIGVQCNGECGSAGQTQAATTADTPSDHAGGTGVTDASESDSVESADSSPEMAPGSAAADTAAEPADTAAEPVDTAAEPVDTAAEPVDTTAEAVDNATDSVGNAASVALEALDGLGLAVAVLDEARTVRYWNDQFAATTGYAPDTLDGRPVETLFDDPVPPIPGLLTPVPDGGADPVEGKLVTADRGAVRHEFSVAPFGPPTSEGQFRCLLVRPVDDDGERPGRPAPPERIDELLVDATAALLGAADRDEMERTVCRRVTESPLYRFAWVGERAPASDRLVVRTSAGAERGPLDHVPITSPESDARQGPAGQALRTGEVRVATTAEDPTFEPWRADGTERGFESVIAVPLQYRETVYGVLVVYTTRSDAFSDRERATLEVLGRTVGLAIHADRNFALLRTDRVVELEFDVSAVDTVCSDTAAALDCELALEGYVASGDRWILYLTVEGTAPSRATERLDDDSRVGRARVIRSSDDEGRLEVAVPSAPLLEAVLGIGAKLKRRTASPAGATLVLEAPTSANVREVVQDVQSSHPGAEFLARRERDHQGATVGRPDDVLDQLTERQRGVLEAAYRAGYYEWPRESTAEEVADALDIAGSTLHAHLRKAQASILAALLD